MDLSVTYKKGEVLNELSVSQIFENAPRGGVSATPATERFLAVGMV